MMSDGPRPIVIAVHGLACARDDWTPLADRLGNRAGVVPLALPGHEGQPADPDCQTIPALADFVNTRRDQVRRGPQVLVGHSMGARIVLEAAARRPDGLAGVVMIDNSLQAAGDPDDAVAARRSLTDSERARRSDALFGGMFCGRPMPDLQRRVMADLAAMSPVALAAFGEAIVRWDAASAAERLRTLRVPMLVLQATTAEAGPARRPIGPDEDTQWTRLVRAQAGTRAAIVNLPGLGHFPHAEAPDRVARELSAFLLRALPETVAP
ncbi:alpha/beta hydrolase [Tsuneonella suprasediminis]|uniref:Alpha/beta hydrolase n=1 Tax=Tsuneonella suprasediminis TaxID=2306996 RepID=A0A419R3L0_9SPHN|nr:alpha/beta hydrolase [Tsuneonella suprasediminis]RJX69123.1 alpha/beta hydrolase [Tsuneonella suprasediminis]